MRTKRREQGTEGKREEGVTCYEIPPIARLKDTDYKYVTGCMGR